MRILSYFLSKTTRYVIRYVKRNILNFALFSLVLHILTPFPLQLNHTQVMKARIIHLVQIPVRLFEQVGGNR
jgi:hypothetical protein